MPLGKPGRLSPDVNSDITAFILNFNSFPGGKAELPHDAQMLRQFRFETSKSDRK